MLRTGLGRLATAVTAQVVVLPVILGLVFFFASPWMPFLAGRPSNVVLGLALIWRVVAAAVKSPAAVLGVLARDPRQRSRSPLRHAVAMVVVLDVAVLVIFQLAILVARATIDPGVGISFGKVFEVGHELLSSVALGTTLGLATGLYLAVIDRGVILFLLGLAFATSQLDAAYFGYDLDARLCRGGVRRPERSRARDPSCWPPSTDRDRSSSSIFFAAAGADLDLVTLRQLLANRAAVYRGCALS